MPFRVPAAPAPQATSSGSTSSGGSAPSYTATYQVASDTQAPTAPTNLTATAISASRIDLAWTAATDNVGVSSYRIERCTGTSCQNFLQIATTAATTYSNTALAARTRYRYRVRAVDGAGNAGPYSTITAARTK